MWTSARAVASPHTSRWSAGASAAHLSRERTQRLRRVLIVTRRSRWEPRSPSDRRSSRRRHTRPDGRPANCRFAFAGDRPHRPQCTSRRASSIGVNISNSAARAILLICWDFVGGAGESACRLGRPAKKLPGSRELIPVCLRCSSPHGQRVSAVPWMNPRHRDRFL